MIKPYYQEDGITIFHGDCREIVLELESVGTVITDPVWPNSLPSLRGHEDPVGLFKDFCDVLPENTKRLVIELGCDSDPRFLGVVPDWLPYLRTCWLEYLIPSYKGRILYTGDVAYAFGVAPKSIKGRRVIPGRMSSSKQDPMFRRNTGRNRGKGRRTTAVPGDGLPHPTPRRLEHSLWLVKWFAEDLVVAPFMGSGTSAVAAKQLRKQYIGIEIEERFCELAVSRLAQAVMDIVV